MNAVNSLYAVTRLNWPEARENPIVMELFKKCKGFSFPLLENFDTDPLLMNIDLPLQQPTGVPDAIMKFIFSPTVMEWQDKIPARWIHYIRASLASLVELRICGCCKHLVSRHAFDDDIVSLFADGFNFIDQ